MIPWLNDRQKEAVAKVTAALVKWKGAVVWWKIGEGKTRIALEAFLELYTVDPQETLLIICSPNAIRQWQDEINSCPYNVVFKVIFVSYGILSNSRAEKTLEHIITRNNIGLCAVDELWLYKNPKSKRSISVGALGKRGIPVVGLSGSLITARNIEDIYGQAKAVGLTRLLGGSLTNFRSQFCVAVEEYGLSYWAKRGAIETIQKRLAPAVDIYFPKDVRETRIQHITVEPTASQKKYFKALAEDYFAEFQDNITRVKGELEIKYATVLLTKLQQVSDGVVLDGERKAVSISSTKYAKLLALLDEYIDAGETPIVWFAFKASLNQVAQALGKKATCLSGDHTFDADGWAKGRYNVALATIGSGASLNDFKNCQYSIIYSAPFSPHAIQQAMGRTNRKGSRHNVCHYTFLSTDGGVDKSVYASLKMSGAVEKSLIRTSTQIIKEYMESYDRISNQQKS